MTNRITLAAIRIISALGLSLLIVDLGNAAPAPRAPTHCPRQCMQGLVDQYLAALVQHDPSGLPFAQKARFTENTQEIAIGEGLWQTMTSAPTTFKIYGVDAATGQAGFIGLIREQDEPAMFALRLKVVNGRITEVEHLISRNLPQEVLPNLVAPRAALLAGVPSAQRTSREDMINAVDNYFEAIEHSDGSIAPFADDCVRHENGRQTTLVKRARESAQPPTTRREIFALLMTYPCKEQLDTGAFAYIFRIWPRRIDLVDEERGMVWAFPAFNEGGGTGTVELKGVPGVKTLAVRPVASTNVGMEVFKIRAGKIHEVEGAGVVELPYGSDSGW